MKKRRTGRMEAFYVAWVLWAIFGLAVLLVPLMSGEFVWTLVGAVIWWAVLQKLIELGGEPDDLGF